MTAFTIHTGDLLTLDVEAIVIPANVTLLGRGGLSGLILNSGGMELFAACKALRICPSGHAVITPGFKLPQRFVIHAVGPVWQGGQKNEAEVLTSCYRAILNLAKKNGICRLAVPAISTGIFGYPMAQAAEIAVHEMVDGATSAGITEVIFACKANEIREIYAHELSKYR